MLSERSMARAGALRQAPGVSSPGSAPCPMLATEAHRTRALVTAMLRAPQPDEARTELRRAGGWLSALARNLAFPPRLPFGPNSPVDRRPPRHRGRGFASDLLGPGRPAHDFAG